LLFVSAIRSLVRFVIPTGRATNAPPVGVRIGSSAQRQRLTGLDLVRGLCALGVMFYHYSHAAGWGGMDAFGTFGVYVFFSLSGFALYYVYGHRQISEQFLKDFFISRILRITPLFFAVAVYRSWGAEMTAYSLVRLVVHGTPLIGIADVAAFSPLVVGGWSIVIEWSFYLLFPVLLLFRSTKADAVAESRRFYYTDTLTFLCYFVGGMFGAHIFVNRPDIMVLAKKIPFPLIVSLILLTVIFAWPEVLNYPSRRQFLSGGNAMLLTLIACALVFLAALQNPTGHLARVSTFLGDTSFAVYLIHTYVYRWVGNILPEVSLPLRIALSAIVTIILAKLIHRYFESPIRDFRKLRGARVLADHA
jgi:peptidoglycan/LPS O-acetylase OafA/YrhL